MKNFTEHPIIRGLATLIVILALAVAGVSALAFFCYGAPMYFSGTDDMSILITAAGMGIGGLVGFWLLPISYLDP